jgi:hypothetical protein
MMTTTHCLKNDPCPTRGTANLRFRDVDDTKDLRLIYQKGALMKWQEGLTDEKSARFF